ncbi:MAG: RsmE family RNA methyltransferase [Thermodesulfobacteriota bacterium]
MKFPRIYVPLNDLTSDRISFPPGPARYLRDVLRLKAGDNLEIFDGGTRHLVRLARCERGEVAGEILSSREEAARTEPEITLAFGCVRPGPFQEILRHGTELGVSRFIPLLTRRTTRRTEATKARWNTVVASAAAQSGRSRIPAVEEPVSLVRFLERDWETDLKLVLSVNVAAQPLLTALSAGISRVVLLVGPEGGLELSEEKEAGAAGFLPVGVGGGVLRTETAALASVAVIVNWYELSRG